MLIGDVGLALPARVWTYSSAVLGLASHSGLGTLRQLETNTLGTLEVRTGAISVKMVRGEVNSADLCNKQLPSREKVHQLMGFSGCDSRTGRVQSAPLLTPQGAEERQGDHVIDGDTRPTCYASMD